MVKVKGSKHKSKVHTLGSKLGGNGVVLTSTEAEVLHLIADKYYNVKQVAIARKCSTRAVYKIRRRLLDKGFMNIANSRVQKEGGASKEPANLNAKIRLHAEHFVINIIRCDDRYRKLIKKGSKQFLLDGNTVILHRNKVEVYSNHSFFGVDPYVADSKALKHWTRFFSYLESKIFAILMKSGSQNITRVRGEFAEVGNELATKCLKEHEKIRVVGDDGKVWLLVDNSFNYNELETVHKTDAKFDMAKVVQPFFNDLRATGEDVILPSQASNLMVELQKQLLETQKQLSVLVESQKVVVGQLSIIAGKKDQCSSPISVTDPLPAFDPKECDYFG